MSTTTTTTTTSTTTTTTQPDSPHLTTLQKDGFIHIPSLISVSQIDTLRLASAHITTLARHGSWPYIRTVPKQFPPWPSTPDLNQGIWGVQHLLHPSAPGRNEFASLYFSDEILNIVKELLLDQPDSEETHLSMELLNLLVSPTNTTGFSLRWHRDDIKIEEVLDPEAELAAVLNAKSPSGRQAHAQYNIALYDDESLIVVPGSHRRARTNAERDVEPYGVMPDEKVVKMRAGDAVFYDSNILHRGVYEPIKEDEGEGRLTLHGSVGLVDAKGPKTRARQVLQHGVGEWIGRDDAGFEGLEGRIGRRAEGMRKRLVEMGSGENVGFSLEG